MKLKLVFATVIALCVTACSDNNEKAIGLYKYKHNMSGTEKISEVKKDGSTYLFVEDVIRKSNAIALTETPEGLSYNNMPLKLSEDGNTLYFSSINGTRIDNKYLDEKLAEIEQNKKNCAALQSEVNTNNKSMDNESWNKYVKSLRDKTPNDCHLIGAGMRW
jgi:uncharacterized lipoprotein YehR (DUF1307 family)